MKAFAAASSIMASNRCETKNLTFNGLKNEGRLTVLGPSAARPGLRAPPTPGFSPRIQTRCCNRRSWRGDENEELQSAAMAEQTTSVAGGGSRQRNNHKQGEDIYDVSVCVCVYLQRSKYQLPGCAQHGSMAVGQVQQGPHALDVLGRQLTEGQTFRMETWTRK